jgi:hypothetical protein
MNVQKFLDRNWIQSRGQCYDTIFSDFRPFSAIFDNFRQFSATFNNFRRVSPILGEQIGVFFKTNFLIIQFGNFRQISAKKLRFLSSQYYAVFFYEN